MSIQCISLPPIRLWSVFVSLGRTSSVMLTSDSRGCFFFLLIGDGNVPSVCGFTGLWARENRMLRTFATLFLKGCHKNQKKYFGNNLMILLIRVLIMKTGHPYVISLRSTRPVDSVC